MASSVPAGAASASSSPARSGTPNSCIRANRGDYNACNVGNSGRGDLPYRPAAISRTASDTPVRTPNDCIRVNHGDWTGCNVGNTGAGDRPYRKAR
jgi:hypothetical protein